MSTAIVTAYSPSSDGTSHNTELQTRSAGTAALYISIIIVNWNTRDLLAECLTSVSENVQPFEHLRVESFVVDNASTDMSAAMVKEQFPWVNLIESRQNLGFAAGNNLALREARGDAFLLLNPDAVLQKGAIMHLINAMHTNARVGIVGAQLLNADGSHQMSWGTFPSLTTEMPFLGRLGQRQCLQRAVERTRQSLTTPSVDWVSGACMLIRRQVTEQIGLLDEDYWLYTEETDWCYRARKAGWQIVLAPTARVFHLTRAASRQRLIPTMLHFYQSRIRFIKKHHGNRDADWVRRIYGLKARIWRVHPHGSPLTQAYPELALATIRAAYRQLQQAMSQQLDVLLATRW